ncbi:heparan-alpha-glucosaminide N-acetyltransferase domain-containing protein [Pleomorphovibrio marinus]|uniref:heparan-alpha-glucosaminide N-acetyltransferase domain-containing protein n=1 Tax=Pleomorphovibrio marinus TaxID=2164132 RepID=UPI000E0B870B|nr:DUF5009 domain-containing protein [Pleomorphovibrio marinus]
MTGSNTVFEKAPKKRVRLHAIDVYRALTMLLMIFVNDLWTLQETPKWLDHVPAGVDGLGLADVVFPAFLFIVGLSIPYAISNRKSKGDSDTQILAHIVIRSLALIIMGVFHVNLESYNSELALLPKPAWQILITIGFFLVWMDYSRWEKVQFKPYLQGLGIVLLIGLAAIYQGGPMDEPTWMRPKWWGILGLIGWGYLIVSLIYLICQENKNALWMSFLLLVSFHVMEKSGFLGFLSTIRPYIWLIDNGATPVSCMGGVIVSIYFREWFSTNYRNRFWIFLLIGALLSVVLGLITRPIWGIHKIGSSPSWVWICLGISMAVYGAMIWLVELKGKKSWFDFIKPAGTSTLTCYLLPYVHYALLSLSALYLPIWLRTGGVGIIKSLFYAIGIILVTGLLEKVKIRLKV